MVNQQAPFGAQIASNSAEEDCAEAQGAQMSHTSWSLRVALLVVVLAVFAVCPVWAQTMDPSTLHIGPGFGTPCAMGCAGDPNGITGSVVDIFQQSGGMNATLGQPVFLIIGIPNDTTNLFATVPINGVTFINGTVMTPGSPAFATGGTLGLKAAVSGGFFGSMTSSDVYTFLFLPVGAQTINDSESFVNWSGADLSRLGITASNFGIYVFALTSGVNIGPNGFINITFSSPLPLGSYAVAFGENSSGTSFATPFTQAGQVVPEPATLTLFGSGMIGLALFVRRRFSTS